jgi:hypothetical protein
MLSPRDSSPHVDGHEIYENQVASLRDTMKWFTGALAGVGAAILVTIRFTEIGDLSGDARAWAILCAVLGLLCVFGAISAGCRVLSSPRPTMQDVLDNPTLKHAVEVGPVLWLKEYKRHGTPSLEELHERYGMVLEDLRQKEAVCRGRPPPDLSLLNSAEEARSQTEQCRFAEQETLSYANYLQIKNRFKYAQWAIAGFAMAALGSCIGFTLTVADGKKSIIEANRITAPVRVAVSITNQEAKQAFEKAYKCKLPEGQFDAWAIGGDYKKPMLVLIGRTGQAPDLACGPHLHQFGDGGVVVYPTQTKQPLAMAKKVSHKESSRVVLGRKPGLDAN